MKRTASLSAERRTHDAGPLVGVADTRPGSVVPAGVDGEEGTAHEIPGRKDRRGMAHAAYPGTVPRDARQGHRARVHGGILEQQVRMCLPLRMLWPTAVRRADQVRVGDRLA